MLANKKHIETFAVGIFWVEAGCLECCNTMGQRQQYRCVLMFVCHFILRTDMLFISKYNTAIINDTPTALFRLLHISIHWFCVNSCCLIQTPNAKKYIIMWVAPILGKNGLCFCYKRKLIGHNGDGTGWVRWPFWFPPCLGAGGSALIWANDWQVVSGLQSEDVAGNSCLSGLG